MCIFVVSKLFIYVQLYIYKKALLAEAKEKVFLCVQCLKLTMLNVNKKGRYFL